VLAGRIPTASGLGTVAAIDQLVATQRLATVLSATDAFTVVHCCARATPFLHIKAAGAAAVSFDAAFVGSKETDEVAEVAEGGLALFAGALPTSSAHRLVSGPPLPPRQTAEIVVSLWRRTGLPAAEFASHVVITPACGLAGVSQAAARAALGHCREAGRIGLEMIAGD
jgi:hypothetical protein